MESSLHRELKALYGEGGPCEVCCLGYRADAVSPDGEWIEVQSGPLGPLRGKLERLLPARRVRIVKPVVLERRIIRRARAAGPDLGARRSPRRGVLSDVFDDLVGLVRVFPHANLRIDVLGVAIEEIRLIGRRRPGFVVLDRRLVAACSTLTLETAADLWSLLPDGPLAGQPFTTLDLAERLGKGVTFAQRVAYCLRLSGAADVVGKAGNRIIYRRAVGRPTGPAVTAGLATDRREVWRESAI
jgi:hypothetical protein